MKPIIGITHGDINGVGYEVIIRALEDPTMLELFTPVIYGSIKLASHYRKAMGLPQLPHNRIDNASQAKPGTVNFINVIGEDVVAEPGQSTEAAGKAALAALERATADLKEGTIDALVTAPINKSNIQCDDFHFAGHTEYLQDRLGDEDTRALMIMADQSGLRVALCTTHIPLEEVSDKLTSELIEQKINDFANALISDFGIHTPRNAVLSLSPHAGDNGLLGCEEEDVIIPAIQSAKNSKIQVFGPYAADGFFGAGNQKKFDGILAMYHDQGLIPFKTLCGTTGVNFTAGLPFVRTSPDHGTAYAIAGKGEADGQSMRSAIYMAIDALRHRANHSESTSNPLKKLYQERGRDN